jgi:hypothetical protein
MASSSSSEMIPIESEALKPENDWSGLRFVLKAHKKLIGNTKENYYYYYFDMVDYKYYDLIPHIYFIPPEELKVALTSTVQDREKYCIARMTEDEKDFHIWDLYEENSDNVISIDIDSEKERE